MVLGHARMISSIDIFSVNKDFIAARSRSTKDRPYSLDQKASLRWHKEARTSVLACLEAQILQSHGQIGLGS